MGDGMADGGLGKSRNRRGVSLESGPVFGEEGALWKLAGG